LLLEAPFQLANNLDHVGVCCAGDQIDDDGIGASLRDPLALATGNHRAVLGFTMADHLLCAFNLGKLRKALRSKPCKVPFNFCTLIQGSKVPFEEAGGSWVHPLRLNFKDHVRARDLVFCEQSPHGCSQTLCDVLSLQVEALSVYFLQALAFKVVAVLVDILCNDRR
jgi:hypothetical protein